ncbi:MAG: transporter substrate-binding domain-containing protein [Deltaproteobacteria bacterium]|nr:transporter substrate-binding domain-containing protein [Candidatus Zymogenaceae bacterium]
MSGCFGVIRIIGLVSLAVMLFSIAAWAQDGTTMPRETVTVGVRDDFAPFSDVQEIDGEEIFTGYDVEIVRAVARDMGVNVTFTAAPPVTLIPMAAEGLVDLVPGMAHRRGWELAVDYSETYFLAGARVLVTTRSHITRLAHLKNKPVAVIDDSITGGFTPDDVIAALPEAVIVTAADLPEALSLLESREVVGVVADLRTLIATVYANDESERYRIVEDAITTTPVGIMLPPDDDTLRERVNFSLMNIYTTGVYGEITETWLVEPLPCAIDAGFVMELWPE